MRGQMLASRIAQGEAFGGYLISVETEKSSYTSGEEVILHIKSHVEVDNLQPHDFFWYSCYAIYDRDTEELLKTGCNIHGHGSAPWYSHDEADDDFSMSIGAMPGKNLNGQVELFGHMGVIVPDVLIDIMPFTAALSGEPSPPPEGAFPWKWVAMGGGGILVLMLLLKKSGGVK